MSRRTLVVIGHGMAGHRLCEALLERDTETAWDVVVLAEEPRPAYDRVALSSVFTGRTADDLTLVSEGFLDHPRLALRLDDPVVAIDRTTRMVTTAAGFTIGYHALVLATGSVPFVPPVPGRDATGVHVYRTIEDLDAIRASAAGARTGVVVGGGLLGLEAANALRSLGLATHVVEFAPRLMPMQVDEAGGQMLRAHVEALGIGVHTATVTERITAGDDGRVRRILFARHPDGLTGLDVDVVVFSAGIRPRDALARESGLAVGERGGVVVDTACRTADPAIYAIGECALAAGRVHGLVAPGYAMAEVVADRLLGGCATFTGGDTSTKLKLLGVDVASFGDAFATTPGALPITFADPTKKTYKKVVLSDDARRVLGGVLVGDASSYAALRALAGSAQALPDDPAQLILPAAGGPTGGVALPDDAQICSCRNVTRGQVTAAIDAGSLTDLSEVKTCTGAGTGCGSCIPLLKSILTEKLAAAGVAVSNALCEHFDHSRAELFEIVRARGITTFSQLVSEHGRGRGCEVCRPVAASILASIYNRHILDGEQAALQDTNDHVLANLQKDGTYSVVPRLPGGEVTPDTLILIGEVAKEFGLYTKITGGQRIDMFGARLEQLPRIWARLVAGGLESGHAYGKALRTVKSCVGETWCRYGVGDSTTLAVELELRYRGLRAPHKIKMGVSGCARECAEARSKDVGIIATENGWNLYLGGNGGYRPRHAELFAGDLDTPTLVRHIDRFLMFYVRTADRLQRTAPWIESLDGGLEHLRRVIVDDALGICADLDEAMARHVHTYTDEWKATLADPDKLRHFVSFVNLPDAGDPDIVRVLERGQPRPARAGERAVLVAGPRLAVSPAGHSPGGQA
ncbi:nitrite reductase large subunit NirB [Protofrankia symbiont of Coriaria ruscifolia]|uniref:assimilatory sulfite reductase (ferredoxin) n=1 Tax=Candidatus Protofrankia californiensis TaxID=1839754 RepID=A0A1C3NT13_9ACTN|nr:nitrite reductase large subunit NirB [Protofrankia symbiont of Coriaria ruscifolia]SBW17360.1 Nitrite reductase [NAD(P)H] large subunit [Candidatus Protofrankia californiensis]